MRLFGRVAEKKELQFINYFRSGRGAAAADIHRAGVYLQQFFLHIHWISFARFSSHN